MSWDERIISEAELARHGAAGGSHFSERVGGLLAQQQATWPLLRDATAGLSQVEYRNFEVKGARVLAQFNPKRIVSTAAKVDAHSIQARPCFLCPANLPPEEQGLAFGEKYVVLCNPFPVLPNHLVIAAREHTPQAIDGHLTELLELAEALGDDYFALYNGPKCGASAPDHLHFQACLGGRVPLFGEAAEWPRERLLSRPGCEAATLSDYRLNLLVLHGTSKAALATCFQQVVGDLKAITRTDEEPLLNLVVTFDQRAAAWSIYLFPRGQHRPASYFAQGEAKLTVSPAGIDLAGVLVVPEAAHFARISGPQIEAIYSEVTLDSDRFKQLLSRLSGRQSD